MCAYSQHHCPSGGEAWCFARIVGPFSGWSLGHVFIFHASFMGGGWSKFEVIRGGSRNGALWREACWMDPVVLDGRETKSFGGYGEDLGPIPRYVGDIRCSRMFVFRGWRFGERNLREKISVCGVERCSELFSWYTRVSGESTGMWIACLIIKYLKWHLHDLLFRKISFARPRAASENFK